MVQKEIRMKNLQWILPVCTIALLSVPARAEDGNATLASRFMNCSAVMQVTGNMPNTPDQDKKDSEQAARQNKMAAYYYARMIPNTPDTTQYVQQGIDAAVAKYQAALQNNDKTALNAGLDDCESQELAIKGQAAVQALTQENEE